VHPTWTTRPRRPDETDGTVEHRFVTDTLFDELEATGFFLGAVALPGLPYRYALPKVTLREVGPIDTVMARAPFIDHFARYFPDRLVYEIEDTIERARARLVERGSDEHEIEARLAGHRAEVEAGRAIASRSFVNDGPLDALVTAITGALHADESAIAWRGVVRTA